MCTRHTIRDKLAGCQVGTAGPLEEGLHTAYSPAQRSPVSGGIYCSAQPSGTHEPDLDGAALATPLHAEQPCMHKSSSMQQLKVPLTLLHS